MRAWAELLAENPAACICLTFIALGGIAAIVSAIRRAGGM